MTFKPYDRVLVRNNCGEPWEADLFAREQSDENGCTSYKTLSGDYYNCIKYEGNEKLLGKTDEPEPKLKFGDHVDVSEGCSEWWSMVVMQGWERLQKRMCRHCIINNY